MQGVVFVSIHQNLRELGDDELRRQCFPEPSRYLAFREYPDAELVPIARAMAERVPSLAQPLGDVLRQLGEEVVAAMRKTAPALLPRTTSLAELITLLSAEERDPRIVMPRLRAMKEEDGRVALLHTGDAAVCRFDEGLLIGIAAGSGERIATRHPTCRARRDETCVFFPRVVTGDGQWRRVSRTFRFASELPPPGAPATDRDEE